METKNLGIVKSIFRQSTAPVRTDVWWFDTVNNVLKSWDTTLGQWGSSLKSIEPYQYSGAVTDYNGNVYHTIRIGSQEWTVENLKCTHDIDGVAIPIVTDPTAWAALSTGAACHYNNDSANSAIYGMLYNYYAATTYYSYNICAFNRNGIRDIGWRLPTPNDLLTLSNYFGGSWIAGMFLKELGIAHWNTPNEDNSQDAVGFKLLPGGYRDPAGSFYGLGTIGVLQDLTSSLYMSENNTTMFAPDNFELFKAGMSVRAVRDLASNNRGVEETICVCLSDEITDLTIGTNKARFTLPFTFCLNTLSSDWTRAKGVFACVSEAPVGSDIIIGTSFLSGEIHIDNGDKRSDISTTPPVVSNQTFVLGTELVFDIDQVGSSTPGKGLKVFLSGTRINTD
jgi:uncharacterized protein (TIGR02145 family)